VAFFYGNNTVQWRPPWNAAHHGVLPATVAQIPSSFVQFPHDPASFHFAPAIQFPDHYKKGD
jgi:hypothetical protein